jgi:ATP-binding cassette subfamily B protein/subfamily B ATP-binding cassette protein MsbA
VNRRFAVARTVGRYLRPHRGAFVLALLPVALISAGELLKPWPLKIVVDHVLGDAPLGLDPAAPWSRSQLLLAACAGLVALAAVLALLQVVANGMTIAIGQRMVDDFRRDLYQHLQRLSPRFYAERSTGDLLYRVAADTLAIQTLAMNGIFPLIMAALLIGGMAVVLTRLDAVLTLMALAVCPALFGVLGVLGRRIRRVAARARAAEGRLYALTQRGLAGVRVVQAFTTEAEESERFTRSSRASLRATWRLYLWQTGATGAAGIVVAAGTALVLWVGASHVLAGRLTVGEVLIFTAYLASLYTPIGNVTETVGLIQSARAGAERVLELLATDAEPVDGRRALPGRARGEIALAHVAFAYGPERPVLHDVSLTARPGEMIAVVGATGSGKTTLVHLLARFLDPTRGVVTLDGVDLRTLRVRDVRRQIAMVLQPPLVFPTTLRENLVYGRPFAAAATVARALAVAQLDGLVDRLPDGLETRVGEGGAALSEGERQRVTIARALVRDAPILVLDEPTSALDAETEAALVAALGAATRDRTVLVIAHRLSTIRHAARVLVLHDGVIVEEGAYDALVARGGHLARLHAAQDPEATPCASS